MSDFQQYLDENLSNIHLDTDELKEDTIDTYDIYEELRSSLIRLRRRNKMTQKELARKAGLTQANISNFETGAARPSLDSLKKIADATGTHLAIDFIGEELE